ncbi:MAG: MFS transporter [Proteobacteria bacterium]|nr:MFS transporter [Pseudomonadota bacterium]
MEQRHRRLRPGALVRPARGRARGGRGGRGRGHAPAHSLISDYFPPQRRATALSVYNMGASLGILLGLFAGGWLSDTYGWRATFFAVGLPGVGMALVVRLGLREPPRGLSEGRPDEGGQPPLGEALRRLAGLRTYRHICLATALYNFASYGFLAWAATFLIRVHGLSATQVGMTLGPIAGIAGAAGGLLGDWGARRDARWQMWVPAIGGFATAPFLILFLTLDNPYWALASYVPAALFGGFWGGPTYAVTQGLVGLRLRTMASAVLLFVLNFIGMGFGPLLVGILSDALQPAYGAHALGYALLIVGLSKVWGAVHSLLGASSVRAELAAARAEAAHPRGSGFA